MVRIEAQVGVTVSGIEFAHPLVPGLGVFAQARVTIDLRRQPVVAGAQNLFFFRAGNGLSQDFREAFLTEFDDGFAGDPHAQACAGRALADAFHHAHH